jgi:hypothetical protein
MANALITSPAAKGYVIAHPVSGQRTCHGVLSEDEFLVHTSGGGSFARNLVVGRCSMAGVGSHGNPDGSVFQQVGGRIHPANGMPASVGYTQATLGSVPGTPAAASMAKGTFFRP